MQDVEKNFTFAASDGLNVLTGFVKANMERTAQIIVEDAFNRAFGRDPIDVRLYLPENSTSSLFVTHRGRMG